MVEQILTVIQETEILGKKIQMYGNLDNPLFLAKDVADWIDYSVSNVSKLLKSVDADEKTTRKFCTSGSNYQTEAWFLTEDGLYEICMQSQKPIAKQMKKEIKQYLKSIRLTGAAIPEGREEEMVSRYFPSFSKEVQAEMVNDLIRQNKELKSENEKLNEFYNDLMNTEGVMEINTVSKEFGIGEYKLFAFLRKKKVFFYNKDMVNVPYERFRKEGKFVVKETPCHDGKIRSVTYATKKGLEYIRKLLRKSGYYDSGSSVTN